MKNIYEIRIHARAGQGANTIAQFLAEAAIDAGKYAQAFPFYGPERSGAPLLAFVRISENPIKIYSQIYNPSAVLVIDETLIKSEKIAAGLEKGGLILVNSRCTPEVICQKICRGVACNALVSKIYTIDANKISQEVIGKEMPNTALLGAFVKIMPSAYVSLDDIIQVIRKKFEKKIGPEMTSKNIQAIKAGYNKIS